jgi:hypothetical protein
MKFRAVSIECKYVLALGCWRRADSKFVVLQIELAR